MHRMDYYAYVKLILRTQPITFCVVRSTLVIGKFLFSSVENIVRHKNLTKTLNSVDLFLYDDSSLTIPENQSIISATLHFMEKTV